MRPLLQFRMLPFLDKHPSERANDWHEEPTVPRQDLNPTFWDSGVRARFLRNEMVLERAEFKSKTGNPSRLTETELG